MEMAPVTYPALLFRYSLVLFSFRQGKVYQDTKTCTGVELGDTVKWNAILQAVPNQYFKDKVNESMNQ